MRKISPAAEIREAAVTKGTAYDPLDAPYLLVVADCEEELPGGRHNGEALLEAVLGTIYTEMKTSETGEQTDKSKPDGYWGVMGAPAHRQVSGVMLLPKPHLWDLRTDRWQPQIVRNGSAQRPLPEGFMPLPGFAVSAQGAVAQIEGTLMADLVGLPAVWPPVEPSVRHRSRRPTQRPLRAWSIRKPAPETCTVRWRWTGRLAEDIGTDRYSSAKIATRSVPKSLLASAKV
jgi:hypothetical protein